MKIYIVYESNYEDLVREGCEGTLLIGAFIDEKKALECKKQRIEEGKNIGFVTDRQSSVYSNPVRMYDKEIDNFDRYYEIYHEEIEVE